MDALEQVVASRRRSRGEGRRQRFTVARLEAILALRHRPAPPFSFTVPLLRSALVLGPQAEIHVGWHTTDDSVVFELIAAVSADAIVANADLNGLLAASLDPDRGLDLRRMNSEEQRQSARRVAWRRLVGRGINQALGEAPAWVELTTHVGTRRFVPADGPEGYVEQVRVHASEPGEVIFRLARPKPTWAASVRAFIGADDPLEPLKALWSQVLLEAPADPRQPFVIRADLPDGSIALSDHARILLEPERSEMWLVRDGARIAKLRQALIDVGVWPEVPGGLLECPSLSLTVDEDQVVRDDAFELLTAWIDALRFFMTDAGVVHWPSKLEQVMTASQHSVRLEALSELVARGGDLLYVWPHDAAEVPERLRNRTLVLTPPEVEWLRQSGADLPLVPLRALGAAAGRQRAELRTLEHGSFAPLDLALKPLEDEPELQLSLRAYVHRSSGSHEGSIQILAYERRIARVTDPARALPGVTLVLRLQGAGETMAAGVDVPGLLADPVRLRRLADRARQGAIAALDELVGRAMAAESGFAPAWNVPLIRHVAEHATAATVGLHYTVAVGSKGQHLDLGLAWSTSPLLALPVGRDRDGRLQRVIDALHRVRTVGGVVVGDAYRRWYTLESESPEHSTWVLEERGKALLERLLGPSALWAMPVVPQTRPHCAPAERQRALLLSAAEVEKLLLRRSADPVAVERLLAHLILARVLGEDDHGLGPVPLLSRYDPRALTPRREVSLDATLNETPRCRLTPTGAVSRRLPTPVLEVGPGIAFLMHEAFDWPVAPPVEIGLAESEALDVAAPRAPRPVPVRPRDDKERALASIPVADPLCVGALHLLPGTEGIELWARGLSVGTFRLPTPLRELAGRLWLTEAGIAAGHARIVALCMEQGRALVARIIRERALMPPGSRRRAQLESFVKDVRAAVVAGRDRIGLAELFDVSPPRESPVTAASLPPYRDLWLGLLIRHALQRKVTLDTAFLSWRAARVLDAGDPGEIELGRRHGWVKAALATDATPAAALRCAALVACEVHEAVPQWGPLDPALRRLLATAAR